MFSPENKVSWESVQIPINPETALKLFSHKLSSYEQLEINEYPEIYHIGAGANKLKPISGVFNFDDDKGDYKLFIGDHIAYRYEIQSVLGQGSFGKVLKVFDHRDGRDIALKIIKNRPRFHQQALEEVEILKYLKEKDQDGSYCIVHIDSNFLFRKHMVKYI